MCGSPQEACDNVWEHRNSDEFAAAGMELYGLYKVAKEGKCREPKPDAVRKRGTGYDRLCLYKHARSNNNPPF